MKKIFKKGLGQLKAELKWKTQLPILSLVNTLESFQIQMDCVQSSIRTATTLKLCSTQFSIASTDLKFLKVCFYT